MIYDNHFINSVELIDSLGIKGNRSGSQLVASCPFHQDRNPSFSVSLEKGMWICFSGKCGLSGNLEQLVEQVLGCSTLEAHRYILEHSETVAVPLKILEEQEKFFPKPIEIMDEGVLIDDMWGPGWFRNRGFNEDDISTWHMMYEPFSNAMVIPVDGGFIKRYPPDATLRYKYSDGLKKSAVLFGYERLVEKSGKIDSLLLVEGSLDCVWGVKYGYDTVAILGSSLSNIQKKKIAWLNPKEVVLAVDNDQAGWKASRQMAEALEDKFRLSYLQIPNNKKDIQELTEEELQKAFNERTDVLVMKLFYLGPWSQKKEEKNVANRP